MRSKNIHRSIKSITLALGLCVIAIGTSAQQDPMYTMYMWNTMAVNPGYAGSADVFNATLIAREQWTGLDGAPSTQSLVLHSPLKDPALGLGLSVVHDKIGPTETTSIFADFAYRIKTSENARLAFGLKAGVNLFSASFGELQNTDANDQFFQQNSSLSTSPNFGFGLYYWSHKSYIGFSAPKLLESALGNEDDLVSSDQIGKEKRHMFLIAGHVFNLGADVKFRPSILAKAVQGAPLSFDISPMFLFMEKLWVGANYRHEDAVSAILAYQITDQFKVGYAYDYTLSDLVDYNNGSHEIMLTYDMRFNRDMTLSPRYF